MSDNWVAVAALVSLVVVCSLSMSIPISRIETKMRKLRCAIETMRVAMRKPRLQFPWNVTLRPWESSSFLTFPFTDLRDETKDKTTGRGNNYGMYKVWWFQIKVAKVVRPSVHQSVLESVLPLDNVRLFWRLRTYLCPTALGWMFCLIRCVLASL